MAKYWNIGLNRWEDEDDPEPWGTVPIDSGSLAMTATVPDYGRVPIDYSEPMDPFGGDYGGPSSLDLTTGFGPDYREPEPEPPAWPELPPVEPEPVGGYLDRVTERTGSALDRLGAGAEGAFGIASFGAEAAYGGARSLGINPAEAIAFGQMTPQQQVDYDIAAKMRARAEEAKAGIAEGEAGGLTGIQAARRYEHERPEEFMGEKLAGEFLFDPLNALPGIGFTDDIARAGLRAGRGAVRAAGEAAEAAGPALRRAGEALADPQAFINRINEGLPPIPEGHVRMWRGEAILPGEELEGFIPPDHPAFNPNHAPEFRGRWFTTARGMAERYKNISLQELGSGHLTYVDVPQDVAALANQPRDFRYMSPDNPIRVLPDEYAAARVEVPMPLLQRAIQAAGEALDAPIPGMGGQTLRGERGAVGQQPGFDLEKDPAQSGMFDNLAGEGTAAPLADTAEQAAARAANDAAEVARQAEMARGQQALPEDVPPARSLDAIERERDALADEIVNLGDEVDEGTRKSLLDRLDSLENELEVANRRAFAGDDVTPEQLEEFYETQGARIEAEILEDEVRNSPVRDLLSLVRKTGGERGMLPQWVSPREYRRLTGRDPSGTQQDAIAAKQAGKPKGYLQRWRLMDQLAGERDFSDGTALDNEVQRIYGLQQRAAELRQRAASAADRAAEQPAAASGGTGGTVPPSAGGIPPGAPGSAVTPPSDALPRQLGVSIQESDTFGSPIIRRLIDEDPEMFYDPIGNKETMAAAAARVDADADGALARVLAEDAHGLDVEAEGLVLLRRAAASGDTAQVMKIARPLALMGTRSGQEVQIWSVLDKLSPEGILITLHRKIEKAAKQGKGAGVQKRIDDEATRLEVAKATAEAEAIVEQTAAKLAEDMKAAADMRRQADTLEGKRASRTGYVKLTTARQELRDILFPTKHGRIFSRAEAEIPEDVLTALKAEAERIAQMPEGQARDDAARALLARADQAAVMPSTTRPFTGMEPEGPVLRGGQRDKDLSYLTDDTVRDVVPREITSERTVITKVKAILKQAGAEFSDEEADEFLDLARELNDLPEDEQIAGIVRLVEDARTHPEVQKGLAGGIPKRLTPEREEILLQRQAADIRKLVHPEARSPFQRLNSPDRLAMARVMAALRRTGQKLTPEQAEAFTKAAFELQDVSKVAVKDVPQALDALVKRTLDTPEIQTAMQGQRAMRDAEAAIRREARQVANDIERMTAAPGVRRIGPGVAENRKAINEIVRVLRSVGVQLPPGKANEFREKAQQLLTLAPGDQAAARATLVAEAKAYDPVAQALARKEAAKAVATAEAQEAAKLASDLARLTNPAAGTGAPAVANEAHKAINGMVALLRRTGARITPNDAAAFREAAQALLPGKLTPEAAEAARLALVERFKASPPVAQELARMLAEAETKRQNKLFSDRLAKMLAPGARRAGGKAPTPRGIAAMRQAQAILTRHGAVFSEARRWLEDAENLASKEASGAITAEEAEGGYQSLMAMIREADPVKAALNKRKAELDEAARLRQRAQDLEDLSRASHYEAQQRVKHVERDVLRTAKDRLRDAGVDLPEAVAQMFLDRAAMLRTYTDEYDQMRAAQALLHDINNLIPPSKTDRFLHALGLPRALKATWDLSFILRQGIIDAYGHPKEWAGAFKANIQSFVSEEVADAADRLIVTGQFGKARLEAGVDRIDRWGNYARGEETFLSDVPGKLPVVGRFAKASERAYITTGNKLRADVWDNTVRNWLPDDLQGQNFNSLDELVKASGHPKEDFERLANWVNITTGRGKVPAFLKNNNQWLNALFFAPRFAVSRFEVPAYALVEAIRTPALRKTLARDVVGFTAGSTAVLALMDQVPGVEVEWDWRSSDFGKMRYGDLRIDFLGGYAPLVRYVGQFATGQSKSTATGRISDINRLEVLGDFLATKLAPTPGEAIDQVRGVDSLGNPVVTWEQRVMHAAADYAPFFVTDIVEAWKAEGVPGAVAGGLASTFGGSISGYSTIRSVQDDVAREQNKGKAYIDLSPKEKEKVNADSRVQLKIVEGEAREQTEARTVVAVSLNNLEKANKATEATLLKAVEAAGGQPNEVLRDYIKEAKQKRFNDSRHAYNQTVDAALKKGVVVPQKDILRDEYWSAEAPEDFRTGELDFKKRDATRADVLKRAKAAGIPENHITERVSPWKDPKVRAAVEAYERDMEKLRPYWDVPDVAASASPLRQQTRAKYVTAKATGDTATVEQIERSALWSDYQFAIREERRRLRQNPEVREAGERWGIWKKEPEGIGLPAPTLPVAAFSGGAPTLPAPIRPLSPLGVR